MKLDVGWRLRLRNQNVSKLSISCTKIIFLFHDASPSAEEEQIQKSAPLLCVAQLVVRSVPVVTFISFPRVAHTSVPHASSYAVRLTVREPLIEFLERRRGLKRSTRHKRHFALQHQRGARAPRPHSHTQHAVMRSNEHLRSAWHRRVNDVETVLGFLIQTPDR